MGEPNYTPEQLARLPRWAQAEIHRLRSNYDWLVAQITQGPEDSDTWIQVAWDEPIKPLGKGTQVSFRVLPENANGSLYQGTIRVRVRDGYIEVYASERLHIIPVGSNVVEVTIDDR